MSDEIAVKPITPDEIASQKLKTIPHVVVLAFNELIAKQFFSGRSRVLQKDVVQEILRLSGPSVTRQSIFDNGWLNVEEMYRSAGWDVYYEKPGFNETGEAYFEFRILGTEPKVGR